MGLSLGVLAALVLLLPGIAFAFALTKLHSQGKPTPKPFDQHFSPVLVVAIVSAFMLHVVATFVWNGLFAQTVRIEPGLVLPLLAGDLDTEAGKKVIESVSQYSLREGFYFFAITFAGLGLGKFANQFFRERHAATWYSLLHPKDADFIWLTADIKLDDECYLIAGVVMEFNVSQDGKLERVVLRGAMRRPLHCDGAARQKAGTVDGWTRIPGEFIVVHMEHARTINVDYYYIAEDPAAGSAAPQKRPSFRPVRRAAMRRYSYKGRIRRPK